MLESLLLKVNTRVKQLEIKRESAVELEGKLKEDLKDLQEVTDQLDKTFIVFDYYLKNNYDKLAIFEDTITAALRDVFNEKYKFQFEMKKIGNNLACNFLLCTDIHEYPLEISNEGNGVKEIIGTVLQLLVIKLKNSIPILILDEPYGGLRVTRQQPVANFLKSIAEEFGIQLIIISHSPEFCEVADNSIEV